MNGSMKTGSATGGRAPNERGPMRVLVTRPIPARGIEALRAAGLQIDQWTGAEPMPVADLLAHLKDADAVLTAVANKIDRAALEAAPRLKIVANMGRPIEHGEQSIINQSTKYVLMR